MLLHLLQASRLEFQQTSCSGKKEEEKENRKRVCACDDEGKKEGPATKRSEKKGNCVKARPLFSINIMIIISDSGGRDLEAPGGK